MSATRSRKEEMIYRAYRKKQNPEICLFCQIKKGHRQHILDTRSFRLIRNIFPYSVWDGQKVVDHLMITPKKHVTGLADLSSQEAAELHKLISRYEKRGYSIYARSPESKIKSVAHQHTHLIKTKGKPWDLIFLIRRPFFFRLPR